MQPDRWQVSLQFWWGKATDEPAREDHRRAGQAARPTKLYDHREANRIDKPDRENVTLNDRFPGHVHLDNLEWFKPRFAEIS